MPSVCRTFRVAAENVPEVVSFVVRLASDAGIAGPKVARLELAVEEWVTNVCRYAYAEAAGEVDVRVTERPSELLVEIADRGPAFDPTSAPEPDLMLSLEERRLGGVGLVLIRRLLDDVRYSRDGRRNVVTFAVSRQS